MQEIILKNEFLEVILINYGARIASIKSLDKNGNFENVILTCEDFTKDKMYLNAICGRTAGRIKNASFVIDNEIFKVDKNNGNHNLHGGDSGFHQAYFETFATENKVVFTHRSPDGEGGFPGNLDVKIIYILEQNELILNYEVTTDKPTLVNLTNHAYFNLSGIGEKIMSHRLQIPADKFLEIDDEYVSTGNLIDVKGHEFDFRVAKNIVTGIDHPFILTDNTIILSHEKTGRRLTVTTDQKAAVIYTGNMMPEPITHTAICIETQSTPDKHSILRSSEVYRQETVFKFDTI
ncbi:MAG: galactose mutarotase [Defluviitaleaceae bacterium]|nr:galactose mutarotase [Defluviitaleaceae bacterium]